MGQVEVFYEHARTSRLCWLKLISLRSMVSDNTVHYVHDVVYLYKSFHDGESFTVLSPCIENATTHRISFKSCLILYN